MSHQVKKAISLCHAPVQENARLVASDVWAQGGEVSSFSQTRNLTSLQEFPRNEPHVLSSSLNRSCIWQVCPPNLVPSALGLEEHSRKFRA